MTPEQIYDLKGHLFRTVEFSDQPFIYAERIIDHLAAAGHLRAPLPKIEGLEEAIKAIDYVHGEYSAGCIEKRDLERAYEVCGRLSKIMSAARAYQKASEV